MIDTLHVDSLQVDTLVVDNYLQVDSLIQRNNGILSQFKIDSVKRRLKKELEKMYTSYNHIDIETSDLTIDEIKIHIYEVIANEFHRYSFIIKRNYPFIPPIIFYQGRPYSEFLKLQYTKTENAIFKQVTGQNCFCCYSVNCMDNWRPGITLKHIIDEIHTIKRKKRDIINKIIADKIKQKYLIDDIDLDQWLFTRVT